MKYLGIALRNIRKKMGLTQKEMGEKLHTKKQFISDLENEKKTITERTALLLKEKFNINMEYLSTCKGTMFLEKEDVIELGQKTKEINIAQEILEFIIKATKEEPELMSFAAKAVLKRDKEALERFCKILRD